MREQAIIRFVLFASLLCAAIGLALIVYGWVGDPFDPFDNRSFSSAAWQSGSAGDRCQMTRDLLDRHLHTGMSREELVALLGAPDEILNTDVLGDAPADASVRTYAYRVGESEWGSDYRDHYLHVRIGEDGRVARVAFN